MRTLFALTLVGVASAAVAQQPQPPSAPKPDKMICKRSAEIGSMIPTRKECHTRSEWNAMAQSARIAGQEMMDRRVSSTPQGQ
ncbi:hypothetical protein [Sphingomonas sp.]|uniref:hypothetical protein n=1 Tax=Sphingomonas sp. TaxID=28214 RepID=UPI0035BC253A